MKIVLRAAMLPLLLASAGALAGPKDEVKATIRYSRFNDPTIEVEPPQ